MENIDDTQKLKNGRKTSKSAKRTNVNSYWPLALVTQQMINQNSSHINHSHDKK